ncbi:MAG TPA: hypothetical protein VNB06_16225 [Thermoanaerobaculia bacterium]|nr:hypothetical protein [Thermoanaerobaculia bacterium]
MTRRFLLSFLLPLVLGWTATGAALASSPESPSRWYGADGALLPFQTDDELVEFLATAPVVASAKAGRGVGGVLKLRLERDGVALHAAFRTVHIERSSSQASRSVPDRHLWRDDFEFELAAYRLSKLLGLHRVPPTAPRKLDGRPGSVQLWIEGASTEADLIESGRATMNAARHLQRQSMLVFDNLIYNFDRHQNNMLYDSDGRLWFIDHTRSFKRLAELPDRERIAVCDRRLLEGLRALDEATLRRELSPYLEPLEVKALVQRRKMLLEHFDKLIAERGEEQVLLE